MLLIRKDNLVLMLFALFICIKLTGQLLNINLFLLLGMTFFVGVIVFIFRITKKSIPKKNAFFLLLFFLIFIPFSLLWTNAPEYGGRKVIILYSILITFILFIRSFIKNYQRFIFYFILVYCFTVVFIAIFERNNLISIIVGESIYRYRIIEELNSNVISVFFAFGALCFIHSLYFSKSKVKIIFNLGLVLISLIFLFLTGSRGALIAFLCSIFLFFLFTFIKSKRRITTFLLGVIIVLILLNSNTIYYLSDFMPSSLEIFFESRYTSSLALESINARKDLFTLALDGYSSNSNFLNLLFGNGIGDFGYLLSGIDERGYPHNIFLEILYELGLIPLILFAILIAKVIIKNYKETSRDSFEESDGMYLMFYFFLVNALSTGDIAANFLLFIYMMAILIKSKKVIKN
jgi:oligosaccharide repeat unit polymerase